VEGATFIAGVTNLEHVSPRNAFGA